MSQTPSKRIVVIGAGSAGLVTLKILRETDQFKQGDWELLAFEQRDKLGGIWLPEPDPDELPNIPQTPLYNSLTTNLPHPMMAFRDFPFPVSTFLYPKAEVVLRYLEEYAKAFELLPHIRFSTRVVRVERSTIEGRATWVLTIETPDTSSATGVKQEILSNVHTIFSANGRQGRPTFPSSIPGLDSWLSKGKASHSMVYREPQGYRNKTVVVVGNGPSALDLAPEIADVAEIVYRSVRKKASGSIDALDRPANESSAVSLVDGTKLSGVDHVLFATGYEFWCPFFVEDVLRESRNEKMEPREGLFNTGQSVIPTSKHLIPLSPSIPIGSLFILGLPRRILPFPLVEAQCLYASAILTGKVHLEFEMEMKEFEEMWQQLEEKIGGDPNMMSSEWHKLPEGKQFDYPYDLVSLSGGDVDTMVPRWLWPIYAAKRELQAAWNDIERKGKGKDKVSGVGEGGEQEWVTLMFDILREYKKVSDVDSKWK
ncbi:FAD/NAD(P)-binding domain-containing protein [Serendipita vermifera]|nr:FAD/NAD(P)-binding domain-containing protein [Serendipita vermifera]